MAKKQKATKEQCQQALQQVQKMDAKAMMKALGQLVQAGCLTEDEAKQLLAQAQQGGGGPENKGGSSSMDTAVYERSHGGTR